MSFMWNVIIYVSTDLHRTDSWAMITISPETVTMAQRIEIMDCGIMETPVSRPSLHEDRLHRPGYEVPGTKNGLLKEIWGGLGNKKDESHSNPSPIA
jgi:hypothetical protein